MDINDKVLLLFSVLDVACGVQAGGTWRAVLLSDDIPSPVVIDAVVSRLSVHTGVVVGSSNPDEHKPGRRLSLWLVCCLFDFLFVFLFSFCGV